ncbi:MAG: dethiobiotin synthase [Nitrospiraceae bacterium]|nr:dethiobiotin synthase [Nitrospiraceae bacterium]
MKTKGFFVTGTDTNVGKTIITAAIVKTLNSINIKTCGMKPIETGCKRKDNKIVPCDGFFLKEMNIADEDIDLITPYCFEHPLAPMVASSLENKTIDINIIKGSFEKLSDKYDAVIVEGVGGLLVPIKTDYFIADIAKELNLPLVIVARPYLGTINHTMLTINFALNKGLEIAGLIMNNMYPYQELIAEKTNPDVVRKMIGNIPFMGVLPFLDNISGDEILKAFAENINIDGLKKYLNK